jgi:hypothetical protein
MFAILVPVALAPLIITLLWAENKAKKLALIEVVEPHSDLTHGPPTSDGAVSGTTPSKDTLLRRFLQTAEQLDLVGLVLLGAAVSLILLPLTISQSVGGQWRNGKLLSRFASLMRV